MHCKRLAIRAWKRVALLSALLAFGQPLAAQTQAEPDDEGLLVVYGALAPTREGDTDHRETIFFSVPEGFRDRIYVRVFDPEMKGDNDFALGYSGNSKTVFRVVGGEGAFTAIETPEPAREGLRPKKIRQSEVLAERPGKTLREKEFGVDAATDSKWVSLGSVRARQGEVVEGRAYFRLDVIGADGDDGNGFSVDVSTARDRYRPPEGLEMFAYQPTIRWPGDTIGTRVEFLHDGGPLAVHNFDGAAGDLRLNQMYGDIQLRASGQNAWAVSETSSDENLLAVTLQGGFETPNDITMSIFDENGIVPILMPPRVAPEPLRPPVLPQARPLADCVSVAFEGSAGEDWPVLAYEWDFGNGATSDEPVTVYSYDAPGRYTATLSVIQPGTAAARGNRASIPVHVRNAPRAVGGDDITVAPGDVVGFDASNSEASDSPITRYLWNFGDGTMSQAAKADKVYQTPGSYRASLRVMDDSNHPCNFGLATRIVTVNSAPVAEAGTDQSTTVGQVVRFDGSDSYDVDGSIGIYEWDLGDGTVLTGPTISHAFTESGVYNVVLTVTDNSGVANRSSTDTVVIKVNAPPVPAIKAPDEPLAVGETFELDGSGSVDPDGIILSYFWEFGDGALGEGERVRYAWARPGVYDVRLTVTDNSGTASASQSIVVPVIVNTAPEADAGPDQYVTASDVQFDGSASFDIDGKIKAYEWDFGDGQTGVGVRPVHAYLRPGTYEVALIVRDDSGAPYASDRDTMMVQVNAVPIADAGPSITVAPGEEFVLDGGASLDPDGEVARYDWLLPDGSNQSGERVALALDTPGLYRARLSVTDDFRGGGASDEAETLIVVNAQPVAVAGPDILVAPDETVLFDAMGSHDADGKLVSYTWEFDDFLTPLEGARIERSFPEPGIWSARLLVKDDSGVSNGVAQDTVTIRVNHTPVAEAGPVVDTDRLRVDFSGAGSSDADGDRLVYTWDFGDGSAPVRGRDVSHVFPRAGNYPVTLRVADGTGLSNDFDIDATRVTINAAPLAVAGGNRDVCSGDPILFDASKSVDPDGGLLSYVWDFGDGSGSELVNPTKTFERPGTYPVTLEVSDEVGGQNGSAKDRIAVIVREGPIADAGEDRTVCIMQPVRLDGSASTDIDGSVNNYEWTFGDGSRASGAQPEHTFDRVGKHTVTLTITGEARGQCSPIDTDTMTVTVLPARSQSVDAPDRAPVGVPVSFKGLIGDEEGTGEPSSFDWDFGDGNTGSGLETEHVFDEPGIYFVTLSTTMTGGQQDCGKIETVHRIDINAAPVAGIDAPESIAVGQTVRFDASGSVDTDGVITAYDWAFGDGRVGQGVVGVHRFEEPGTYTVALRLTDDAGVGNSETRVERQITVNPVPRAALIDPPQLCAGEPYTWMAEVEDSTSVSWRFGDDTAADGAEVSKAFDAPGLYPVTAFMDDGRGLANSRFSEEVYARVNAAPMADAGADRIVCPGEEVRFSGKASDPDGTITGWQWEFSDGVVLEGAEVSRSFDMAGPVEAKLIVLDDSGSACEVGQDTASILVNAPPMVDAGPDRQTPVGAAHDELIFSADGARDPDGQGITVSWDFGDGGIAKGTSARHRFGQPGEYVVTVTARDSTGLVCGVATDTAVVSATPRGQGG